MIFPSIKLYARLPWFFISSWSDFPLWRSWCRQRGIINDALSNRFNSQALESRWNVKSDFYSSLNRLFYGRSYFSSSIQKDIINDSPYPTRCTILPCSGTWNSRCFFVLFSGSSGHFYHFVCRQFNCWCFENIYTSRMGLSKWAPLAATTQKKTH